MGADCDAIFKHEVGKPFKLNTDGSEPGECWDEHASWEIKPGIDGPGEARVKQSGKTYEMTFLKTLDEGTDNASNVCKAVVHRVGGVMVLRYSEKKGMYLLVGGINVMKEQAR